MSVHVCKCTHNGIEEYHLRYPGMSQEGAQRLADKINAGWMDNSIVIAAIKQADQWRLAVDQLLSGWYSTADSYTTPHEAIKALIAFEVMAALDPKVSSDAAALVERGRREEREFYESVIARLPAYDQEGFYVDHGKEVGRQYFSTEDVMNSFLGAIRARGEAQ